jgi:hypothetical protein
VVDARATDRRHSNPGRTSGASYKHRDAFPTSRTSYKAAKRHQLDRYRRCPLIADLTPGSSGLLVEYQSRSGPVESLTEETHLNGGSLIRRRLERRKVPATSQATFEALPTLSRIKIASAYRGQRIAIGLLGWRMVHHRLWAASSSRDARRHTTETRNFKTLE